MKSYQRGRESFQSETLDYLRFDEEPPVPRAFPRYWRRIGGIGRWAHLWTQVGHFARSEKWTNADIAQPHAIDTRSVGTGTCLRR